MAMAVTSIPKARRMISLANPIWRSAMAVAKTMMETRVALTNRPP